MRTARRSIGQLSGQQLKSTAKPVDNDHFIDAGMDVPKRRMQPLVLAVCSVLLLAALPFLIVLASALEERFFGTWYVQRVCRGIGIHSPIKKIFRLFFPA